jgi:hypothetical protein
MEKSQISKDSRQNLEQTQEKFKAQFILPMKAFFTLKEACEYKSLNYKTACNRTLLQPNSGKADGQVGGRKVWRYSTIQDWISLTDAELA